MDNYYINNEGIVDLVAFKKEAIPFKESYTEFLQKFDSQIPEGIEKIVADAEKATWDKIDCTKCAGCCRQMTPVFLPEDSDRISEHLKMNVDDFNNKYTEVEADSGNRVIKDWPCALLKNNLCTIYEVRPADCAGFPHLEKRPFDEYNETHIQNIDKCPATFEFVKYIKAKVEDDYEW